MQHAEEISRTTQTDEFDFLGSSSMGTMMRRHDWSHTPLGPMGNWPQSLRSALHVCLASSFPIGIYWGPHLTLLYNDAWGCTLGSKHPWALGRAGCDVWPKIWDTIGAMFTQASQSGSATGAPGSLSAKACAGFADESYVDCTFSPIRGESGRVDGIVASKVPARCWTDTRTASQGGQPRSGIRRPGPGWIAGPGGHAMAFLSRAK